MFNPERELVMQVNICHAMLHETTHLTANTARGRYFVLTQIDQGIGDKLYSFLKRIVEKIKKIFSDCFSLSNISPSTQRRINEAGLEGLRNIDPPLYDTVVAELRTHPETRDTLEQVESGRISGIDLVRTAFSNRMDQQHRLDLQQQTVNRQRQRDDSEANIQQMRGETNQNSLRSMEQQNPTLFAEYMRTLESNPGTRETLEQIRQGIIFIPDQIRNDFFAQVHAQMEADRVQARAQQEQSHRQQRIQANQGLLDRLRARNPALFDSFLQELRNNPDTRNLLQQIENGDSFFASEGFTLIAIPFRRRLDAENYRVFLQERQNENPEAYATAYSQLQQSFGDLVHQFEQGTQIFSQEQQEQFLQAFRAQTAQLQLRNRTFLSAIARESGDAYRAMCDETNPAFRTLIIQFGQGRGSQAERDLIGAEFDAYRIPIADRAAANQRLIQELRGNTTESQHNYDARIQMWSERPPNFDTHFPDGRIALSRRLETLIRTHFQN